MNAGDRHRLPGLQANLSALLGKNKSKSEIAAAQQEIVTAVNYYWMYHEVEMHPPPEQDIEVAIKSSHHALVRANELIQQPEVEELVLEMMQCRYGRNLGSAKFNEARESLTDLTGMVEACTYYVPLDAEKSAEKKEESSRQFGRPRSNSKLRLVNELANAWTRLGENVATDKSSRFVQFVGIAAQYGSITGMSAENIRKLAKQSKETSTTAAPG